MARVSALRVIHYVNQFFGGIGGEDKADAAPSHRPGPVGPGIGLAKHFGLVARRKPLPFLMPVPASTPEDAYSSIRFGSGFRRG